MSGAAASAPISRSQMVLLSASMCKSSRNNRRSLCALSSTPAEVPAVTSQAVHAKSSRINETTSACNHYNSSTWQSAPLRLTYMLPNWVMQMGTMYMYQAIGRPVVAMAANMPRRSVGTAATRLARVRRAFWRTGGGGEPCCSSPSRSARRPAPALSCEAANDLQSMPKAANLGNPFGKGSPSMHCRWSFLRKSTTKVKAFSTKAKVPKH